MRIPGLNTVFMHTDLSIQQQILREQLPQFSNDRRRLICGGDTELSGYYIHPQRLRQVSRVLLVRLVP